MARFLPYDQTGFDRVDARAARAPFAAGFKWMDPRLKHKSKDWSSPEGIMTALQLTKAIVEHPITDLAVKGIGEAVKGAAPDVSPIKGRYEKLMKKAALARQRAEDASKKRRTLEVGIQSLGGKPSDDQIRHSMGYMDPAPEEDIRAFKGGLESDRRKIALAAEDHKRHFAEAERLEREARGLEGTVVRSMDDLFAFVSREGATKEDLAFALKNVSKFSPARSLSQIRAGVDPANKLRIQLRDTFLKGQKGSLSEYQDAMLRLRADNYKSMDQKRKDEIMVRRLRARAYHQNMQAAIDLRNVKGIKTEHEIHAIHEKLKVAKTKQQMRAVKIYIDSLGKGFWRKYPAFYKTMAPWFKEYGMELLPPSSIIRDRGSSKGSSRRSSRRTRRTPSNAYSALAGFEQDLGLIERARKNPNITKNEMTKLLNSVSIIVRDLKGYRATSRSGKSDIRKARGKKGQRIFIISSKLSGRLKKVLARAMNQKTFLTEGKVKKSTSMSVGEKQKGFLDVAAGYTKDVLGKRTPIVFKNGRWQLSGNQKKLAQILAYKDHKKRAQALALKQAIANLNNVAPGQNLIKAYKRGY